MDWLNDRKNLPLIASICVVVVLGAVVFILYQQGYLSKMLQSSTANSEFEETGNSRFLPQVVPVKPATPAKPASGTTVASAVVGSKKPPELVVLKPVPVPVKPVKTAPVPPKPAVAPAPPKPASLVSVPPLPIKPVKPVAVAAVVKPPTVPGGKPVPGKPGKLPLEPPLTSQSVLKGKDPFNIPGPKTPMQVAAIPRLSLPPLSIVRYRQAPPAFADANTGGPSAAPSDQGAGGRRVSGIMYSNGVYALLEANGQTYTVQPGDQVEGDRVISIQADGLMLRTSNNILIHVPLNGGADSGAGAGGGTTVTSAPRGNGPPAGARF